MEVNAGKKQHILQIGKILFSLSGSYYKYKYMNLTEKFTS